MTGNPPGFECLHKEGDDDAYIFAFIVGREQHRILVRTLTFCHWVVNQSICLILANIHLPDGTPCVHREVPQRTPR